MGGRERPGCDGQPCATLQRAQCARQRCAASVHAEASKDATRRYGAGSGIARSLVAMLVWQAMADPRESKESPPTAHARLAMGHKRLKLGWVLLPALAHGVKLLGTSGERWKAAPASFPSGSLARRRMRCRLHAPITQRMGSLEHGGVEHGTQGINMAGTLEYSLLSLCCWPSMQSMAVPAQQPADFWKRGPENNMTGPSSSSSASTEQHAGRSDPSAVRCAATLCRA